MFQSCSIEESVYSKRDNQKFYECDSSSFTEDFESFVEDFVTHKYYEKYREYDISIDEDIHVDEIKSKNSIESEEDK